MPTRPPRCVAAALADLSVSRLYPDCATPRHIDMTVVPTAPASCWNVLNIALPSGCIRCGMTPIPAVIVLGYAIEKPIIRDIADADHPYAHTRAHHEQHEHDADDRKRHRQQNRPHRTKMVKQRAAHRREHDAQQRTREDEQSGDGRRRTKTKLRKIRNEIPEPNRDTLKHHIRKQMPTERDRTKHTHMDERIVRAFAHRGEPHERHERNHEERGRNDERTRSATSRGRHGRDRGTAPVEREDERDDSNRQQHKLAPTKPHTFRRARLTNRHDTHETGDHEHRNQNGEQPTPTNCRDTHATDRRTKRGRNRAHHVADAHKQPQTRTWRLLKEILNMSGNATPVPAP